MLSKWRAVTAVAVAALAVSACGKPDRSAEADRLEQVVAALPAVEYVDVRYSGDVTAGHLLRVDIRIAAADLDDVGHIAQVVEDEKVGTFDEFDQRTTFAVGNAVLDRGGRLDPAAVEDDLDVLHRIGTELPEATVRWRSGFASDPRELVEVRSADVGTASSLLRDLLPPHVDSFTIVEPEGAVWTIHPPLSGERERRIVAATAESPLRVLALTVGEGVATEMRVEVGDPATLEADLVEVIGLFGAGTERPLLLVWEQPGSGDERGFGGSVHVGGCEYPSTLGETDPERFYSGEALDMRERLRARYDSCE